MREVLQSSNPYRVPYMRPAQGMLLQTLVSIGSASALFLSYSLLVVVRTQPWWQPQVTGVTAGVLQFPVYRVCVCMLRLQ